MSTERCKCYVTEKAHEEGRGCGNYREASAVRVWLMDHSIGRHIAGRIWLAVPEKARWRIVGAIHDRRPDLCWCDLVDAAYLDVKRDDYECGCEVPLPTDATAPRYGRCYCQPPTTAPTPTEAQNAPDEES